MSQNLISYNGLMLTSLRRLRGCRTIRSCTTKAKERPNGTDSPDSPDSPGDDIEIPVNPLRKVYSANKQPNGKVYDSKPFKLICEEGKTYHWCLCGQSKRQPFCDGTHNNVFLKIPIKPIKFTVTKTKEYWLCNCKQTSNRPFCDGSHKAIKEVKFKKP